MHAYHIDILDLFFENTSAPWLFVAVYYALGWDVRISWITTILFVSHDSSLHSINPYSVMYFNPVLDYVFKANITHQLHHALNRGYLLFWPYYHVFPASRKADIERYNQVFKTQYEF